LAGKSSKFPQCAAKQRRGVAPWGSAIMSGEGRVCCAACGQYFAIGQTDIVGYGTGYRCLRCSEAVAVADQAVAAIDASREREDDRGLFGMLFDFFLK
jgi:hypothetical protein